MRSALSTFVRLGLLKHLANPVQENIVPLWTAVSEEARSCVYGCVWGGGW
jgi:hypothetical protein